MKVSLIEARDLSEAWFLCLRKTLAEGHEYKIERGSYAGERRKELDFVVIRIRCPGTRPLTPDVPQGVPPPTTMEYVESYLPYLMTAHRAEGEVLEWCCDRGEQRDPGATGLTADVRSLVDHGLVIPSLDVSRERPRLSPRGSGACLRSTRPTADGSRTQDRM